MLSILQRAFLASIDLTGESPEAIIFWLLVFVVTLGCLLFTRGWEEMTAHVFKTFKDGLSIALVVWFFFFLYQLVYKVPRDIYAGAGIEQQLRPLPLLRPPAGWDTKQPKLIIVPRPFLKGDLDQVTGLLVAHTKGPSFLVKMTPSNTGEATAVRGFQLHIRRNNKEIVMLYPMVIDAIDLRPTWNFTVTQADSLPVRAASPIKRGDVVGGFLLFTPSNVGISDEESAHFEDPETVWSIEFADYQGNVYHAEHRFTKGENFHAPFHRPPL